MKECIQAHAPLAWQALTSVATNEQRRKKYNSYKVFAAFSILMHSRSRNINAFQMANAVTMYRHDITKEGLLYLAQVGLTVSYATLHKKLRQVEKTVVTNKLIALKKGLEDNTAQV